MPLQAHAVRNANTTQYEGPPRREAVRIESGSYSQCSHDIFSIIPRLGARTHLKAGT
jgi:hypothetical protein